MEVLYGDARVDCKTIVIIGNFDGIHTGHKLLVERAWLLKDLHPEMKIAVLTFLPHPREFFTSEKFKMIFSLQEKIKEFDKLGFDYYKICDFNLESSSLSPYEFVERYLLEELNAKFIIIGEGYNFGKDKTGNVQLLKEICEPKGVEVYAESHLEHNNLKVSSTVIRDAIINGDMKLANKLLGKTYYIEGVVFEGRQIGRTIGFPTANIVVNTDKLLPKDGVYRSSVCYRNKYYYAITNVGTNPTVNGLHKVVETHLLDFDGDMYGEMITVYIYEFIRGEVKFNSIEELKLQIKNDIEVVKKNIY